MTNKQQSIASVVLNVQRGIEAQTEMKENRAQLARLYVEWGFKACERGLNLEGAMLEFEKIYRGS